MQVKMLVEISGLRNGVPWPPRGGILDLPDDEAATLCAQRMAVPVHDPEIGVERAVLDPTSVETRGGLVEAREALVPTKTHTRVPRTAAKKKG